MKAIMTVVLCFFWFALPAQNILPHPVQSMEAIARVYEDIADEHQELNGYYLAACYWTLAGDHENAFRCLFHLARYGYCEWEWLEQESDLAPLRSTPNWRLVILHVKSNRKVKEQEKKESPNKIRMEPGNNSKKIWESLTERTNNGNELWKIEKWEL